MTKPVEAGCADAWGAIEFESAPPGPDADDALAAALRAGLAGLQSEFSAEVAATKHDIGALRESLRDEYREFSHDAREMKAQLQVLVYRSGQAAVLKQRMLQSEGASGLDAAEAVRAEAAGRAAVAALDKPKSREGRDALAKSWQDESPW